MQPDRTRSNPIEPDRIEADRPDEFWPAEGPTIAHRAPPSGGQAAERIRRRHILVLVDLNGHCGRPQFEILSLRPAPIQLTYMGHPGTSGAPAVQYVLVDPITSPPRTRAHFSEAFLSMPQWHVTDYRFSHAFSSSGPADRPEGLGEPPAGAPAAGRRLPWPTQARHTRLEAASSSHPIMPALAWSSAATARRTRMPEIRPRS